MYKSKEATSLLSNFIWLTILQVATYLFPLLTMPYLAKVIGADGFGKIAFAAAIMVWIQTITDWGFNYTATRDTARNRDNILNISHIFSDVLWARSVLALISLVVLLLLIFTVPIFQENRAVILVTFMMIPGHILFPDWFFQAVEKMRYITIFNVLIKLLFTIAVFIFIKEKDDYIIQPLLISVGYMICGVISMYLIVKKWGVILYKPSLKRIYSTIRNSIDVFINNLAPNLYNSFSVILLGNCKGDTAVGVYDGANKFYSLGYNVVSIFTRVFYPYLSRKPEKHSMFVWLMVIISILLSLLIYFLSPWVVKIFLSSDFTDSIMVIRILSVSLVFTTISAIYGTCYLIIHNKEQLLRKITIYCSLCGFLLAWPLVKQFSFIGAALTVSISRFLLGITTMIAAKYSKL